MSGAPAASPVSARRHVLAIVALALAQALVSALVMAALALLIIAPLAADPLILWWAPDPVSFALAGAMLGLRGVVTAMLVWLATGALVTLVGLAVRLLGPARRFWLRTGEVTVAMAGLGIVLLVLSFVPFGRWGGIAQTAYEPQSVLLVLGWLLVALGLHLFVWPHRWMPASARARWERTFVSPVRENA